MTAAAVFGEKSDQRVDALQPRPVAHEAPLLPGTHQPGLRQRLQVKGQGRHRQFEPLPDHAHRQPFRLMTNEQTEDRKAAVLRQRPQRGNGFFGFHIFMILKIWKSEKSGCRNGGLRANCRLTQKVKNCCRR